MTGFLKVAALVAAALALVACQGKGPAAVDSARILAADNEPGNWMTHGRTYSEQRFSPLDKINAANVSGLGLAWNFELSTNRGVETTPIVVAPGMKGSLIQVTRNQSQIPHEMATLLRLMLTVLLFLADLSCIR